MVSKKNAGVSEEAGAGLELAGAASGSCERFDVVIVGCGSSGLYTALNLPAEMSVLVLTKTEAKRCDSMLAQGGICVLLDEDDYDSFYEDTMRAGHYENRPESVDIMIRSSRAVIESLIGLGVAFERTPKGDLAYTREGGHTRARICYHADTTGQNSRRLCFRRSRSFPMLKSESIRAWSKSCRGGRCMRRRGSRRRRRHAPRR